MALLALPALRSRAPALALGSPAAQAADCGNDAAGFDAWLGRFRAAAAAQGISNATLASALAGVTYDPNVIRLDRSQRSFKLSFEQFYARRVSGSLISRGQRLMGAHQGTLSRIEQRFGVPAPVVIAIWGLETNYGGDGAGGKSIMRSLATLAYDCRRSEFFRNELMSALKIINRGDMSRARCAAAGPARSARCSSCPRRTTSTRSTSTATGARISRAACPTCWPRPPTTSRRTAGAPGRAGAPARPTTRLREWNKAEVYVRTISVMADRLAGRTAEPR